MIVGRDQSSACSYGFASASAPRIPRDPSGAGGAVAIERGAGCVVVHRADDDGTCPGHRHLHAAAEQNSMLVAALQILHLTGATSVDPGREAFASSRPLRIWLPTSADSSDSGVIKARARGPAPSYHSCNSVVHSAATSHLSAPLYSDATFRVNWMHAERWQSPVECT